MSSPPPEGMPRDFLRGAYLEGFQDGLDSDDPTFIRECWASSDAKLQADDRTDLVAPLIEAALAVKGHDKIDPDETECPINWDEWAYIREKLIEEMLRLVTAYRKATEGGDDG